MHSFIQASTQRFLTYLHGELVHLTLPAAEHPVPGHNLLWGKVEEIGSPAYWSAQAWMWELEEPDHYKLGRTFKEEVLACILGGYGIPAEVGLAAYARLRGAPATDLRDERIVSALLSEPLSVNGRNVRYRFVRQKAGHIASSMASLDQIDVEAPDKELRDSLIRLPGVGPKTASWIVRNWRGSDHVSILDIHIVRACRNLGLFDEAWRVERHYPLMEEAYLAFAGAVGARASVLDSVIWMTMRLMPSSIIGLRDSASALQDSDRKPKRVDTRQMLLI